MILSKLKRKESWERKTSLTSDTTNHLLTHTVIAKHVRLSFNNNFAQSGHPVSNSAILKIMKVISACTNWSIRTYNNPHTHNQFQNSKEYTLHASAQDHTTSTSRKEDIVVYQERTDFAFAKLQYKHSVMSYSTVLSLKGYRTSPIWKISSYRSITTSPHRHKIHWTICPVQTSS